MAVGVKRRLRNVPPAWEGLSLRGGDGFSVIASEAKQSSCGEDSWTSRGVHTQKDCFVAEFTLSEAKCLQ